MSTDSAEGQRTMVHEMDKQIKEVVRGPPHHAIASKRIRQNTSPPISPRIGVTPNFDGESGQFGCSRHGPTLRILKSCQGKNLTFDPTHTHHRLLVNQNPQHQPTCLPQNTCYPQSWESGLLEQCGRDCNLGIPNNWQERISFLTLPTPTALLLV
jgi:hypothetical protein